MIFGHKNDIEKLLPYVSEDLRKALEYLAATDFSKVADGRYVLDGEKMYANVENYTTADRSTKKPEAHNKYIDVQYLGKGTEKIYFAPRTADVKVVEDYAEERDLLFFENIFRKSPIMARIGIHEDGFSQFIMDEAAFPPSRLERPMSHDVSAAPRFEPIMTPIDCRSVIVPELTNPTTITVVAEDDCTIAVTTSPSRKPLN